MACTVATAAPENGVSCSRRTAHADGRVTVRGPTLASHLRALRELGAM